MITYLGRVAAGTTLYVPFHTFNSSGASVTLTGLAVTDIEIYKNGSTTQRSSDNGYTLLDTDGIDFDGITGIHGFSVDLSDNSDAGFYAAGGQYWIVVSAVTVDAQTVNFVAGIFSIEPAVGINVNVVANAGTAITSASGIQEVKVASIAANAITATAIAADAITAAKVADGTIDANTFATGAITATAIAADAITDAKVASDVTIASVTGAVGSVTGAVGSVTGNVGGNVTGSVGSVVGAVGSVTGNVGGNVTGSVGSVTGLTASDVGAIKAKTDNLPSDPADASDIAGAFSTVNGTLATLGGYIDTEVAAIKLVTDKLDGMTELGAGSPTYYRFGSGALEQAPTGGSAPSAATVADAVWDEARAGHVAGGSFGEGVASVTGAVASVTGNVGGNVTGSIGSVASGGISAASLAADTITAAKVAADVTTELQTGLATASALATVDTVVDAILAMLDDARGEPGQGAPPVNPDMATKVDYLYKLMRNKITQTSTTLSVFADDATTVDHKATVSDDAVTYTRSELATGP